MDGDLLVKSEGIFLLKGNVACVWRLLISRLALQASQPAVNRGMYWFAMSRSRVEDIRISENGLALVVELCQTEISTFLDDVFFCLCAGFPD